MRYYLGHNYPYDKETGLEKYTIDFFKNSGSDAAFRGAFGHDAFEWFIENNIKFNIFEEYIHYTGFPSRHVFLEINEVDNTLFRLMFPHRPSCWLWNYDENDDEERQ